MPASKLLKLIIPRRK